MGELPRLEQVEDRQYLAAGSRRSCLFQKYQSKGALNSSHERRGDRSMPFVIYFETKLGMRALIISLALLSANVLFAQTGPAGVGSTANNSLWLKADLGTSTTVNGNPVSSWGDASSNSNTATSSGSQHAIYTSSLMNGMPALFFDNASSPNNDLLSIADNNNLDNTTGLT